MTTDRLKIFVTRRLPQEALDRLGNEDIDLDLWDSDLPPDEDSLRSHSRDTDGILCLLTDRIDSRLIEHCNHLRVISNMAVGTDNIDLKCATERSIPVGNTPGVLTDTTADFAFALLISAARRIVEADAYVREGHWKTWGPNVLLGYDLHGATLGIIGLGAIGRGVALRAKGFSMNILYTSRSRAPGPTNLNASLVTLEELLTRSDFVSLHVPLTSDTRNLIGEREFSLMKQTSVLVNTSRGGVIDQQALIQALKEGRPAMAALDVTTVEPIASNDELLTLPNLIITPHIASASVTTRTKMANMAVDNLLAGLRGDPLPNCVNVR